MADDFQIATPAGIQTVRAIQLSGSQQAQLVFVAPMRKTPVGPPEKLTVGTGAVVTLTPPGTATHALLVNDNIVSSNWIRWYDDGSAPTSVNGAPLAAGDYLELDEAAFANFKMIAVAGTATAHVIYWRYV